MKVSLLLSLCAATLATAIFQEQKPIGVEEEKYTIELEHGVVHEVTEDEKWELRRVCHLLQRLRNLFLPC